MTRTPMTGTPMTGTNPREGKTWPGFILGGRMRTSTLALIIAFIGIGWLYETYEPPQDVPDQVPAIQVVPPGFIPDPAYTWAPRTDVQRHTEIPTPETTEETTPTTTPTTTPPSAPETTPASGEPTSGPAVPLTPAPSTSVIPVVPPQPAATNIPTASSLAPPPAITRSAAPLAPAPAAQP